MKRPLLGRRSMANFIPHPYQQRAIDFCLDKKRCALFLDMGLGKTAITLSVLNRWLYDSFEASRVLVIAPARIIALGTWQAELKKWAEFNALTYKVLDGTPHQRWQALTNQPTDLTFISISLLPWLALKTGRGKWPFDTVVVDESSGIKNPKSKQFQALRRKIKLFDRLILLTGTPAANGYLNLWSQLYMIDRGARLETAYTRYRATYFEPGKQNGGIVYTWSLPKKSKALIDQRIADVCLSMTSQDWLDMPELIINKIEYALEPHLFEIYKQLESNLVITLFDQNEVMAGSKAIVMGKLMQLSGGGVYDTEGNALEVSRQKLDILANLIDTTDKPILCFYRYAHEKARIKARFKARELITEQDVANWNDGKIPLLIAHPASMGYGLNLQYGSNVIVWFGPTWSLEEFQQANARLYRQGQKEAVIVHVLIAKDTIDEKVMSALEKKEQVQSSLMDALKREYKGL